MFAYFNAAYGRELLVEANVYPDVTKTLDIVCSTGPCPCRSPCNGQTVAAKRGQVRAL